MATEEGFLALAKEGHDEGRLRVAQAEAKELHPGLAAVQVDIGLAPVNLRLAGIVVKGDHHLRPGPLLPDVLADCRFPALETELRHQPLVDAAAGVPLLGWPLPVFLQPAVNDA